MHRGQINPIVNNSHSLKAHGHQNTVSGQYHQHGNNGVNRDKRTRWHNPQRQHANNVTFHQSYEQVDNFRNNLRPAYSPSSESSVDAESVDARSSNRSRFNTNTNPLYAKSNSSPDAQYQKRPPLPGGRMRPSQKQWNTTQKLQPRAVEAPIHPPPPPPPPRQQCTRTDASPLEPNSSVQPIDIGDGEDDFEDGEVLAPSMRASVPAPRLSREPLQSVQKWDYAESAIPKHLKLSPQDDYGHSHIKLSPQDYYRPRFPPQEYFPRGPKWSSDMEADSTEDDTNKSLLLPQFPQYDCQSPKSDAVASWSDVESNVICSRSDECEYEVSPGTVAEVDTRMEDIRLMVQRDIPLIIEKALQDQLPSLVAALIERLPINTAHNQSTDSTEIKEQPTMLASTGKMSHLSSLKSKLRSTKVAASVESKLSEEGRSCSQSIIGATNEASTLTDRSGEHVGTQHNEWPHSYMSSNLFTEVAPKNASGSMHVDLFSCTHQTKRRRLNHSDDWISNEIDSVPTVASVESNGSPLTTKPNLPRLARTEVLPIDGKKHMSLSVTSDVQDDSKTYVVETAETKASAKKSRRHVAKEKEKRRKQLKDRGADVNTEACDSHSSETDKSSSTLLRPTQAKLLTERLKSLKNYSMNKRDEMITILTTSSTSSVESLVAEGPNSSADNCPINVRENKPVETRPSADKSMSI